MYASDSYAAAANCDALLILTEWKEFSNLDLRKIRLLLKYPIVIDGRNLYPTDRMTSAGLTYYSVGRSVGVPEPKAPIARRSETGLQLPLPTIIRLTVAR
jgi:UDPglucose 6-dehydrogenase